MTRKTSVKNCLKNPATGHRGTVIQNGKTRNQSRDVPRTSIDLRRTRLLLLYFYYDDDHDSSRVVSIVRNNALA